MSDSSSAGLSDNEHRGWQAALSLSGLVYSSGSGDSETAGCIGQDHAKGGHSRTRGVRHRRVRGEVTPSSAEPIRARWSVSGARLQWASWAPGHLGVSGCGQRVPRLRLPRPSNDEAALAPPGSGVCETRLGRSVRGRCQPGVVRVARDSSGVRPLVRALAMNRPGVHGGAGLAPAVGLIRSLSALGA